jgi:hypothetical protein
VSTLPEQGQVVELRRRPFVVQDVLASGLPRDPIASAGQCATHHLVTLSSVEDDALGNELRVVLVAHGHAHPIEGFVCPRHIGRLKQKAGAEMAPAPVVTPCCCPRRLWAFSIGAYSHAADWRHAPC